MKNKNFPTLFLAVFALTVSQVSTIAQGTWTQKANFIGTARWLAVGFSIGNKGYIGTGYDGINNYQDFWEWDQTTNVWTQKANFGGTARRSAVGFSIGTKGYIGTGFDSLWRQDFWEWDQTNNLWTQKANFAGGGRTGAFGFSIGIKGYIGTGATFAGYYVDFWEWDQSTDTWTQKAIFPGTPRDMAVGFSIGNKGYMGTGDTSTLTNPDPTKEFWEWDQATNFWTQKTNFGGTVRYIATGFSIGTKGYIGTGRDYAIGLQKDFWEWDQTSDTWTQKANFSGSARYGAVGFSIGTKGYIGLGQDSLGHKQDFWEYTPDWLGVNEIKNEIDISIYPNPFSTQTTMSTANSLINATLTVDNCFGQTVAQIKNINGQTIVFNRDNLSSGLYLVRLTEKNKTIAVDKLVITDK